MFNDFSDYAQPLIDKLIDDQNHQQIDQTKKTIISPIEENIEGTLTQIQISKEDSINSSNENITVSEEDSRAAQSAYPMAGIDVLAFYKSFRFKNASPFKNTWGIFLIDAGIEGLTQEFKDHEPNATRIELRQLAMDLLLAHERYHFWIDVWALSQEITPLNKALHKQYEPYLRNKTQVELTRDDLEESLANHYAFKRLKNRKLSTGSAAPLLKKVLQLAPIPYSDFLYEKERRVKLEGILSLAIANGITCLEAFMHCKLEPRDAVVLSTTITPTHRMHPAASYSSCPVHLVRSSNYAHTILPFQGPDRTEFRRYITEYLNGQSLAHTDHDYFRIDNQQKIKFPNPHDKSIRGYEMENILKKAGMYRNEYLAERKRTKSWRKECPRPEPKPPLIAK